MKGSIPKKGDFRHAAAVSSRKRRCPKRPKAKNQTQRHLNEILPQIPQSACREAPKIRFAEFAEAWLESYAEINVKQSTLARYRDIIRQIFNLAMREEMAISASRVLTFKPSHVFRKAVNQSAVSPSQLGKSLEGPDEAGNL